MARPRLVLYSIRMKIVIAASIYPPEVGGPATYAAALKESLLHEGHEVTVVLYGALKKLPSGVRHLAYTMKLLWYARGSDGIIAFDTYSGGLPATLVHLLLRTPLAIRLGGDFVWELYIERTHDLLPLTQIYSHRDKWNWKERMVFWTSRFIVRHAQVVFSSPWQMNIWRDAYRLGEKNVHVIENAIENKFESIAPVRKNFLFYTRQIALKNAPALHRAFAVAKAVHPDLELDEGMVLHTELMERMRACYAVVLPSISEVTPNYIIDALRCGKPFLLTKYSGYAERFGHYGVLVDPLDEADITRGITKLADPTTYDELCARIASWNETHTYDDIAREFVAVLIEKKS